MRILPGDPTTWTVPDDLASTSSGEVTVDLDALAGSAQAAQETADTALANAATAQSTAEDAIADAEDASAAALAAQGTADTATTAAATAQATATAAVPLAYGFLPWGISGHWGRLSHQPHVVGYDESAAALATSVEAGRIVYFPCSPTSDIPIVQIAVEVTNTPVGTSATVCLARYTVAADGSPGSLVVDYSVTTPASIITLANAPPALTASSAFASITIPKGNWHLACLFLGAVGGTPPQLRVACGHPSIGCATLASINLNGGYRSPDTTNAAFPPTATIGADQGRGGILVYAKRA